MRKIKLQMQLTLDGFVGGPNGEMDWMTWNWDDELKSYVSELTNEVDCILIGHNLAKGFIPYWASVKADPSNPEQPFGSLMTDTPKVVFSRTLQSSEWDNTTIANDPVQEVKRLKAQPGGDIIIYGGASLVSSFIKHDLIDEYNLFVNPVAIGNGLPIFKENDKKFELKLVSATPFPCGIVTFQYVPSGRTNQVAKETPAMEHAG
jgi:dihydrofolate reductase